MFVYALLLLLLLLFYFNINTMHYCCCDNDTLHVTFYYRFVLFLAFYFLQKCHLKMAEFPAVVIRVPDSKMGKIM